MITNIPKAFISYSHDTQQHKKWVLELATRLLNNGIDAILDQFELQAGDDLAHFMETNLASADKILMLCTENYVEKANKGVGGVGYEKMIITSNLMKHIDQNKVVPIVKQNSGSEMPTFLKSKLYIDFSNANEYEFSYDNLVRSIHNSPLFKKPKVGNNPFKPVEKEQLDGDIDLLHKVLQGIVAENEKTNFPDVNAVAKHAGISKTLTEVGLIKIIRLGYANYYLDKMFIVLTDRGKLYAYENKFLK